MLPGAGPSSVTARLTEGFMQVFGLRPSENYHEKDRGGNGGINNSSKMVGRSKTLYKQYSHIG